MICRNMKKTLLLVKDASEAEGRKEMSSILANHIAPSNMRPNAGGGGVEGSQPMNVHTHADLINCGDLTPYLTYDQKIHGGATT
jgi:hypothetical protein